MFSQAAQRTMTLVIALYLFSPRGSNTTMSRDRENKTKQGEAFFAMGVGSRCCNDLK